MVHRYGGGGSILPVRTAPTRGALMRVRSTVWAILALMVMVGLPLLVAAVSAVDYVVTARRHGTRAQQIKSMRRRWQREALLTRG